MAWLAAMHSNAAKRRVHAIIRNGALRLNDYMAAHAGLNAFAKRILRLFPRTNERVRLAIHRGREIRLPAPDMRLLTVNELSPRALQVYFDLVAATTSRDESVK
jgi:hypothetical protein